MIRFYLASGNAHKVAELQALAAMGRLPVAIHSAREVGGMPDVVEDTGTFAGNARKKARALRARIPADAWALADDSGLCVDALEGAPGVDSAYYAGPEGNAAANLAKLIDVLSIVPDDRRGARFHCVLVAIGPGGCEVAAGVPACRPRALDLRQAGTPAATRAEEKIFEGSCHGKLLRQARGGRGFGYDPIFVPDGYAQTYSELGDEVKNRISHRARAWAKLAEWVQGARIFPRVAPPQPNTPFDEPQRHKTRTH